MEIISTTSLISINATFIAQLLSFLIFVFILNRIMLRPLNSVIQQRNDYMAGMKQDISSSKQKLSDMIADLEKKRNTIKNEAFHINDEVEQKASNEAVDLFSSARKQIIELSKAAEQDVARQLKEAQKYFEEETQTISVAMMEQVLGRKIS